MKLLIIVGNADDILYIHGKEFQDTYGVIETGEDGLPVLKEEPEQTC